MSRYLIQHWQHCWNLIYWQDTIFTANSLWEQNVLIDVSKLRLSSGFKCSENIVACEVVKLSHWRIYGTQTTIFHCNASNTAAIILLLYLFPSKMLWHVTDFILKNMIGIHGCSRSSTWRPLLRLMDTVVCREGHHSQKISICDRGSVLKLPQIYCIIVFFCKCLEKRCLFQSQ